MGVLAAHTHTQQQQTGTLNPIWEFQNNMTPLNTTDTYEFVAPDRTAKSERVNITPVFILKLYVQNLAILCAFNLNFSF